MIVNTVAAQTPLARWVRFRNLNMFLLAKRSGVSSTHVQDLVKGRRNLENAGFPVLTKLAGALDCSVAELLKGPLEGGDLSDPGVPA
jgi:transcriptional regulator with XRE-family HTH domain